jgi:hypothetical protein
VLTAGLVGDIAHGTVDLDRLSGADAADLVRHELGYAVRASLTQRGVEESRIPEVIRAAAHRQAMRSIAVSASATRAAALLDEAGVRSLAFKGPALAVQTTGSWLGRGSADIDVLISPADGARADQALREAGCWSRAGYDGPPGRWERYHRGERVYLGLPVTVDLHWRVDSGPGYFSASFDDLWSRREAVEHDGLAVQSLDRVDALLVTAEHGAKERWARWFWALDAVRQVEQLDPALWPEVARRATAAGCVRAVDQGLGVALACGARMPAGIRPTASMEAAARALLEASAAAPPVEWSRRAALARRRQRWSMADRPAAATDSLARSVARLIADRRAPGVPQVRATPPPPASDGAGADRG